MKQQLSVNRLAQHLLNELIENQEYYQVKTEKTKNDALIVDAGIEAVGGYEAGRLITEICMGGCGSADLTCKHYGQTELLSVLIRTDHPVIATLGSQYAGWQINEKGYFAIGSGPARALALKPRKIYEEIAYEDDFEKAIVVLETDKKPPAWLISKIAEDCETPEKDLTLILTPTTSSAGATQIAGRIVETGIHKLRKLGLNVKTIMHAWGCAPIPPLHPDFKVAMARTNDVILYGGTACYSVAYGDDEELSEIVNKAPSKASKDYGAPFIEVFEKAGYDFYRIDSNLFAPALVKVNNVKTGNIFTAGEINDKVLMKSLGF